MEIAEVSGGCGLDVVEVLAGDAVVAVEEARERVEAGSGFFDDLA